MRFLACLTRVRTSTTCNYTMFAIKHLRVLQFSWFHAFDTVAVRCGVNNNNTLYYTRRPGAVMWQTSISNRRVYLRARLCVKRVFITHDGGGQCPNPFFFLSIVHTPFVHETTSRRIMTHKRVYVTFFFFYDSLFVTQTQIG